MTARVKICGLDTPEHVEVAVRAGADAIGVVSSARSPRHRTPQEAARVLGAVPPGVARVLVVNDTPAARAIELADEIGAGVVQLHGGAYGADDAGAVLEAGLGAWRATSLSEQTELHVGAWGESALLLDAPDAGSGRRWDLGVLTTRRPDGPWLLAGGLDPDNVAEAIALARPGGVDVSSGVEGTRGRKDPDLIRRFVAHAREALARLDETDASPDPSER